MGPMGIGADAVMPPFAKLLGRPEEHHDFTAFSPFIRGRRVMVTGAGGSIGSEICRMLAPLAPSRLLLLDRDESALEAVRLVTGHDHPTSAMDVMLADIRDTDRVARLFREHRPEIIFHAAALKHVPLLQRHPEEALLTNVLGTINVLSAAANAGASTVVNLSSDKAADAVSALGYSKYISERLVAWFGRRPGATRFLSVRLGNVLGTRGSMWDVFLNQLVRGSPLTLTSSLATRYLTTPREAVYVLLSACRVGPNGATLVQDPGVPVRIRDIVDTIIEHHGGDIAVHQIGLRPGERLHEVMVGAAERTVPQPGAPSPTIVHVPSLDPTAIREWYARTAGRVTVALLRELAEMEPVVSGSAGNAGEGDARHEQIRDRFGIPLKWALHLRRAGRTLDRELNAWGERETAALGAATLLLDERYEDALAVLEKGPLTIFRDIFNAGVAHEQAGHRRRAHALLEEARAMDPARFGVLRSDRLPRHANVVLSFPLKTGGRTAQARLAHVLADFGLEVSVFQLRDVEASAGPAPAVPENVKSLTGHQALIAELRRRPWSLTIVGSWMDYLPVLAAGAGPVIGWSGGDPTLNESESFDERFLAQRHRTHQLPVRLLTCSRFVQAMYRNVLGRSSAYVPVALDARAFQRARPPVDAPLRVLLMAWDGYPNKGLGYAVPALRNLLARGLDIRIVWVTPQAPVEFVDLDCELHVDPPKDALFEVLRSCHVLVYPPPVDGLGIPPLEAMAAGVPVVVTDSGGSAEFIEPGTNCLVVENASVSAIESAVERLYTDPSLRARLGEMGRLSTLRHRPANADAEFHGFLHRAVPAVDTELLLHSRKRIAETG